MTQLRHRQLQVNGLRMHIAEQGRGPLVLLCHGFPESWYSFRHQLPALAAAGYHAVAPDMRGYGHTGRPTDLEQYTLLHLVGDMIGLIDALEAESAVIVGHDWGAPVAWHTAQLRPDRIRAVAALGNPFYGRGSRRPTQQMPRSAESVAYTLYFQEPGVAEAELESDVRDSLLRLLYALSGDAMLDQLPVYDGMVSRRGGLLDRLAAPAALPDWLTPADLDFYTVELSRTGFRGGLSWYRNIDRNWELLAPFQGQGVAVPALFIAGEHDPVLNFPGVRAGVARLGELVPRLRRSLILPGCGHWTQQERPAEVNAALLDLLGSL